MAIPYSEGRNPSMDRVKQQMGDMADQAASTLSSTADDLASRAGAGLHGLGAQLKSQAPREGTLGAAAQAVADRLQAGGQYMERAKFQGMQEDLATTIRKNPLQAVLIGLGIGLLFGRIFRR